MAQLRPDSTDLFSRGPYEVALGEAKELIVALDCVEIDEYVPIAEIVAAQDLVDRIWAMLSKLICSARVSSRD